LPEFILVPFRFLAKLLFSWYESEVFAERFSTIVFEFNICYICAAKDIDVLTKYVIRLESDNEINIQM